MKRKDKQLYLSEQIKSIDLKKKEITFKLVFRPVLRESKEKAENLLNLLLEQNSNFFSDIPIRGLRLEWSEFTEEAKEENKKP